MSNDVSEARQGGVAAALFSVIFLLIAWDLFEDFKRGTGGLHKVLELTVLLVAAGGAALLLRRAYAVAARSGYCKLSCGSYGMSQRAGEKIAEP